MRIIRGLRPRVVHTHDLPHLLEGGVGGREVVVGRAVVARGAHAAAHLPQHQRQRVDVALAVRLEALQVHAGIFILNRVIKLLMSYLFLYLYI